MQIGAASFDGGGARARPTTAWRVDVGVAAGQRAHERRDPDGGQLLRAGPGHGAKRRHALFGRRRALDGCGEQLLDRGALAELDELLLQVVALRRR